MSNDFNFEQFIKLLDGALASDDKNVKQALRKFLFVAAMVMGDNCEPGPFTRMMETMDGLQRRISTLENAGTFTTSTDLTWTDVSTTIGTPFVPPTTTTGPNWTSGSITSSGGQYGAGGGGGSGGNITSIAGNTTSSSTITSIAGTGIAGSSANWWVFDDAPGTNIKEDIKKSIEKLAK